MEMIKNYLNKTFIVYEHLFPNGKRYFGITSKNPNARWENGHGYDKKHQPVMYNAIQKYGWDNISHNILFENLTFEEATEMEKLLIEKYKTNCVKYGDEFGYNMTDGGEGVCGRKVSEEIKQQLSKSMTGKKGKDCPNSKIVVCDGVEYDSLNQWREEFNYPKGNVNGWLCGKVCMPRQWYDKRLHYKHLGFDIVKCQKESFSNKIMIDGIVFDSQAKLATYLNVTPSTICCWMSGNRKVPQEMIDRGLAYVDKPNANLQSYKHNIKTMVEYDGVVFESQADLARYLNVNKATLNSWLLGKNKMPKNMIEKGLRYIK